MSDPIDDQIRTRAHQLWELAGKPLGREQEFWLEAERNSSKNKQPLILKKSPTLSLNEGASAQRIAGAFNAVKTEARYRQAVAYSEPLFAVFVHFLRHL